MGLLVRFVGLVILLATLVAAAASFFYNEAEEADQAARVAMQVNMRLRDHVAVLEGVRALYQSDPSSSGPGIRAYLSSLQPQVRTPGMEGIGIAAAIPAGVPQRAEEQLRENYGEEIKVWPATDQKIGFPVVLVEPYTPRRHVARWGSTCTATRRAAPRCAGPGKPVNPPSAAWSNSRRNASRGKSSPGS
jgi:CHASE1-domain containing sensor protein